MCVWTGCIYSHLHCPLCYCVLEVSLVFSTTFKTKVGANQPTTDILTCESGVETAFYQPPSVSCCF